MKLKAVLWKKAPRDLVEAVESEEFYSRVLLEVLGRCLRVIEFGPAEFYIQACDVAVGSTKPMCEVRLSGVSVTTKRSTQDYWDALCVLEDLYRETMEDLLPEESECQLFVAMMLDRPPLQESSSLLEREPVYVRRVQIIA